MFYRIILIVILFGTLNNVYSQNTIRITKVIINYNSTNHTEWERDTLIYEISSFANGGFEKTTIYNSGISRPLLFFVIKRDVIDSCEFFKIISQTLYDSSEIITETYYGKKQTHFITRLRDSTILTSGTVRYKRSNENKIKEATWVDYRNNQITIERLKVKRLMFGMVKVKKWEEYDNETQEFNNYHKEVHVINKNYSYSFSEGGWKCFNISKHEKSKVVWEISRDYIEMKSVYTYNKEGQITKKSVFDSTGIRYSEEYQYTDINSTQ